MDSELPVSRRVKQASRVLFTVALMYPDTCYASVRYKLCSFLKVLYFLYFHRLHDQSILGYLLLCVVSVCGFLYLYTLCLSLYFHNISRRAICSEHLASGKILPLATLDVIQNTILVFFSLLTGGHDGADAGVVRRAVRQGGAACVQPRVLCK